ncbi:hypothetical protein HBN50_02785 [Halobacteriovorax sp. GB3]|uniref:hypothetical protein n=1 Tax=Halobacteriovorax sp. GB3 TaxID=2719615 RepID=UPI0023602E85|nr:hypothetical protein [Halobacteriovorax sp. GB3]MDD0852001.1 hypothetical protein [Halobacteriovorax sp. GB3]
MKSISFLMVFLFISIKSFAALSPAETLLSAYSSQCPETMTSTVRGSLINVKKIISVVEQLKENSQCYGGSDFSGVFGSFHSTYSEYEIYRQMKGDKIALEKKVRDHIVALNMPGLSESELEYLKTSVFESQTGIMSLEADISRFEYLSKDFGLGTAQFLTSMNGFLQTWAEGPMCFDKKTSTIASLVGNGLMAASSFADPGTGIALAASGVLVNSISQFIMNFKHNKLLENLDDIQMPTAISCVSEALSKQYCNAIDTLDLIEAYKDDLGKNKHSFEGVDLLSNHMGELKRWLTEVHAGSPMTDEGEMQRRLKPFEQYNFLTKIKWSIETYQTLRNELIKESKNPSEKTEIIASSLVGLANIMFVPTLEPNTEMVQSSCYGDGCPKFENPIFTKRSAKLIAYQIFNPTLNDIPICTAGENSYPCSSFKEYVRSLEVNLTGSDWTRLVANSLLIVEEALIDVNEKRAKTISADPFRVLAGARRDTGSLGRTNAYNALKMISRNATRIEDYLTSLACSRDSEECENGEPTYFNTYFDRIKDVKNTKAVNDTIVYLLKSALSHRDVAEDQWPTICRESFVKEAIPDIDYDIDIRAQRVSKCISTILKLNQRGVNYFFAKIRAMVSYEVEGLLVDNDYRDKMQAILYATRSDLVDSLTRTYGSNGDLPLEVVETGLERTLGITVETLDIFFETFNDQIMKSLKKAQMTDRVFSELCFRLLPYAGDDTVYRKFLKEIYPMCRGSVLQQYKNGPKLVWDDFVEHRSKVGRYNYFPLKTQTENYCALSKYRLKNQVFRDRSRKKDLLNSQGKLKLYSSEY